MDTQNRFTEAHYREYQEKGYTIVPAMFSEEEVALVMETALADKALSENVRGREDKEGNVTKLSLWYSLGEDVYSNIARSDRYVLAIRQLLGGTPAHYHTKLMQKEPHVGGAWEWHQDYGYWYHDGFLLPKMLSVMLALTEATVENGCLQVLEGSHLLERIDHGFVGGQKGADAERVAEACKQMELVHVALKPGDVLFFHANLLHRSDKNGSEKARWSLISTYNLASNKPFKPQNPSCYTPIEQVFSGKITADNTLGISAETADFKKS